MKVKDILTDETKWIKGDASKAYDKNGYEVNPCSPTAVQWSLLGALLKVYQEMTEFRHIKHQITKALLRLADMHDSEGKELMDFMTVRNMVRILDV